MIKIGILSLQGAIEEHESSLQKAAEKMNIDIALSRVILPQEIENIDGIVMPGGESSAMILIGTRNGMLDALMKKLNNSLPAFGTCAGAILLTKKVRRTTSSSFMEGAFPLLNIEVLRNGYGRQAESFSTLLDIKIIENTFECIFIRAPVIQKINEGVKALAYFRDDPVLIQQDNLLVSTFHPELTNDSRIHEMFLKIVSENK